MADKWEFYTDKAGEYRWRCTAPNGEPVGRSTEGYKQLANCQSNTRRQGWTG